MKENSQPPVESNGTPQSAALAFVKKSNAGLTAESGSPRRRRSESKEQVHKERSELPPQDWQAASTSRTRKPTYLPFSTRIRADLKRRLKRLSHHREDQGYEQFAVTDFVEEAIMAWLDRQEEP